MHLILRRIGNGMPTLRIRQIVRGYSTLTDKDVSYFESLLGKRGAVTDTDDLVSFNCDWTGEFRGNSKLALLPSSAEQVSEVMKYCYQNSLAVVPQGGNTGLVGGSIPIKDEVIISLKRMNKIQNFDEILGAITCEAGVTLQSADAFVRTKGYVMPIDLGSKGSCHVAGNLATNAGGIRLVKYGSLRGNVLGLEVVLPNGEVMDSMRLLRKDNVGYDLKQLFVGSEGTLGIITRCSILTPPLPTASNVALLALPNYEAAVKSLTICKQKLGSDLSAFEYFDRDCAGLVQEQEKLNNPLQQSGMPFFVVLEASGSDEQYISEKLNNAISNLMERKLVNDAVIAENIKQYQDIWGLRERITSSLRSSGMRVLKYDVSLSSLLLHKATAHVNEKIRNEGLSNVRVFEYGHLGDGNLHFNAACDAKSPEYVKHVQQRIEHHLYGFVKDNRGSISAEHGLGQLKATKISYSRSPSEIRWMRAIKQAFDPKGLLNPYKVLL